MKTYLVTGAAGFIGSNFIKYLLYKKYKEEEIKIIVLDLLTYAGNYGTIKDDIDGKRCVFVHGDIRDRELADKLFSENDIDYVVNFAAESHVDRSIENPQLFLETNILGTQNLLDAARRAWVTARTKQDILYGKPASDSIKSAPTKCTALWARTVSSQRTRRSAPTALTVHQRQVPT